MESNKVKGLIFPVGGEAQAFLADRDRPYRDIREAVQGEYDELGATFADVDIYVNAAGCRQFAAKPRHQPRFLHG